MIEVGEFYEHHGKLVYIVDIHYTNSLVSIEYIDSNSPNIKDFMYLELGDEVEFIKTSKVFKIKRKSNRRLKNNKPKKVKIIDRSRLYSYHYTSTYRYTFSHEWVDLYSKDVRINKVLRGILKKLVKVSKNNKVVYIPYNIHYLIKTIGNNGNISPNDFSVIN